MKGFTVVELLVSLLIGSVFISFFVLPVIHVSSLREGKHTGYVTAIEQKGYLFPNYKVYFKTDNSSSQEDDYCVNRENKKLAELLKTASAKRQLVTISFDGVRGFGFDLCHTTEIKSVVNSH